MVAALIYQRGAHTINMFIWPTQAGNDLNLKYISRQGFFLYHWSKSGMNYWAISDLNTADLQVFVQLIQALT
jgi:anti-sigma factor RsiW